MRFSRPTIARPGLGWAGLGWAGLGWARLGCWAHRVLEASNHFSVFGAAEADKKVTIGWRQ